MVRNRSPRLIWGSRSLGMYLSRVSIVFCHFLSVHLSDPCQLWGEQLPHASAMVESDDWAETIVKREFPPCQWSMSAFGYSMDTHTSTHILMCLRIDSDIPMWMERERKFWSVLAMNLNKKKTLTFQLNILIHKWINTYLWILHLHVKQVYLKIRLDKISYIYRTF